MSSSEQGRRDPDPTSALVGAMDESRRPYIGTSLISDNDEINMTNCRQVCLMFFKHLKSMHFKVVIAYWMMAGYIGGEGVGSSDASYRKGFDILFDLVHKQRMLKLSDDQTGMIEFAGSSAAAANANANCRHSGSCFNNTKQRWFFDFYDGKLQWCCNDEYSEVLPKITRVVLWGEDEMLRLNGGVGGGSTYCAAFNPTPDSLNTLLQNANNPSLLLLRGLPESSLPILDFILHKSETLRVLEISGSTRLTTTQLSTISRLSMLRYLNISFLPIRQFPTSFFRNLKQLKWLILRGCCKLLSLDLTEYNTIRHLDVSHCTSLQKFMMNDTRILLTLDLSYTPLDPRKIIVPWLRLPVFPFSTEKNLSSTPDLMYEVQVLDLSGSTCFTKLDELPFTEMPYLEKLDLSWTKVKHLPSFANHTHLLILSLRGLELESLEALSSLQNQLIELNLTSLHINSSPEFFKLDFLGSLLHLQFLNLSQTSVAKLPDFLSYLVALKELLLANCQCLNVVPDLQALTKLVKLDLSLPNDSSSSHNRQLHFETKAHHLSSSSFPLPMSLKKLILTNRSGIQKLFQLTTFDSLNLEILDLRGTDVTAWESKLEPQQSPQETIPKPTEIHVVFANDESNCQQSVLPSTSDDVGEVFTKLISNIQENLSPAMAQEQVERLHNDLRYIQENYDRIKSSSNRKSGKELFQELMDAATNLSTAGFAVDSASIKQLLRIIVKLKLLVPRKQIDESEAVGVTNQRKKKTPLFRKRESQENDVMTEIVRGMQGMEPDLLNSYESLTTIQRNCLLCFSVFPYSEDRDNNTGVLKSLVIKKKILIYWWVGEGFIDPHLDQEMMIGREIEARTEQATRLSSATKVLKKPITVEEIGRQILNVLAEKGFIKPVMKKSRESGSCCIHPFVHAFVIGRAKEECFLDFDQENGKLAPHFTRSRRACLLKLQDSIPSSCALWANHIKSSNKLKSFEAVKTVFNVSETMIGIKREWFSRMKNLSVLHLGVWQSESTDLLELNDQMFLEDLKKMRQLRLLSLQGLPTIAKLPDSVCYLRNLIILDLKECNYLEELPADIGYLKNLTHLDISNCPLVYKLPKGISLLSKLEVLRGFVITDVLQVARDSQVRNVSMSILSRWWDMTKQCGLFCCKTNEACTFRDLLKLKKLRELSIVVNISKFPEHEDLLVFREMNKLCKLKILWQKSICTDNIDRATHQELSDDREERKHLDSIEKLELWCFPYINAPHWLNPRELKNLKKLYTVAGNLRTLHGSDTNESRWNVETLRLKLLRNLDIEWPELKTMFPKLMYLETVECGRHGFFPCNSEGVWRAGS